VSWTMRQRGEDEEIQGSLQQARIVFAHIIPRSVPGSASPELFR
jgi:hypothetical protein